MPFNKLYNVAFLGNWTELMISKKVRVGEKVFHVQNLLKTCTFGKERVMPGKVEDNEYSLSSSPTNALQKMSTEH